MATIKAAYAAAAALTLGVASLVSDANLVAGRASTAVDNTSNLYDDVVVGGFITTGTTPTVGTQIEIWAYGSYDGTTYTGGATGTDANLTPEGSQKGGLKLLAVLIVTATSNVKYSWGGISLAAAFGGVLPPKWGIYVVHNTAVNLNSTAGNHECKYSGVTYTVA